MASTYENLPAGLPTPVDDGAASHLGGLQIPSVRLSATTGDVVDIKDLAGGFSVIYIYPRSGRPGAPLPEGWDAVPGARGCTPESMGFRDSYRELTEFGAAVFGLSSQDTPYQQELADRLGLPFPLLSDERFLLADALALPTFEIADMRLYKRLTLVVSAGVIEHVFYPVFPTDTHAAEVVTWLAARAGRRSDQ